MQEPNRNSHYRWVAAAVSFLTIAIGIITSGIGVGTLVLIPFTQLLISDFGWRFSFFAEDA